MRVTKYWLGYWHVRTNNYSGRVHAILDWLWMRWVWGYRGNTASLFQQPHWLPKRGETWPT